MTEPTPPPPLSSHSYTVTVSCSCCADAPHGYTRRGVPAERLEFAAHQVAQAEAAHRGAAQRLAGAVVDVSAPLADLVKQ